MRLLTLMAVGCVVLAGCAKTAGSTEQAGPESFAGQIAAAIVEAEAGGAGDAQLAILRQAQTDGEITLEDARAAARAGVECVNGAGSSAFYQEYAEPSGLVVPGYSSSANTGEEQAIANRCGAQEDYWVNMVYQLQPASLTLNDAYLEQQAPIVRSCMERNGYTIPSDATTFELLVQASQVSQQTDFAVDCLTEAAIGSF